MSKPSGKCIFCDGGGLSKEHIFPQWMQPLLGLRFSHTDHQITRRGDAVNWPKPGSHRPYQQGDPLVHKLRVVCQGCNNGWMSRLQTAAKPILKHLLFANWTRLRSADLPIISAWVTMSTMVWEFADPATVHVSAPDRRFLFEHEKPPQGWHIFIAKYEGVQDRFHLHTALTATPKPGEIGEVTHGQLTTLCIGNLACIAYSETEAGMGDVIRDGLAIGSGYVRIWPSLGVAPISTKTIFESEIQEIHGDLLKGLTGRDPEFPSHRPPVFE